LSDKAGDPTLLAMSPRCLLYCSNRETARLFSSFLRELHFDVEHCAEIFEAVKRLTSHAHEVIIVDWDEGPEAAFLLKTARELQSNRDAFVIAMAKASAVAAAREAGANEVVTKPPVSEIKNGLVSSRDFLAGLERRLELPREPRVPVAASPVRVMPSHNAPPVPVKPQVVRPVQLQAEASAAPALTFASFDGGWFGSSPLHRILAFGRGDFGTLLNIAGQRNTLLRLAVLVVAFFTVGYVASQPLSQVGDSMAEMYQQAWGISAPASHHVQRAEARQVSEPAPAFVPAVAEPDTVSPQPIRVTPLYNDPPQRQKTPSQPHAPAVPTQTDAPPVMAEAESGLRIPQSLTSQFPGAATMRDVADKIKPAILGAFEPVNLPGYLADKLLVDKVDPSYPEKALQAGLQGPVVLQAWIGRDGRIRDLKLIRGPLLLGQAAYKAVKQWRYQPYLMNGEAVEAQTYVTVDFKLP